jgi:hypothetical protein
VTLDPSADSTVAVTLNEYTVEPDSGSVEAGKIQFVAENAERRSTNYTS